MSNDTDLPKEAIDGPDTSFNPDFDSMPAAPPGRFGRLALCVAAASALALGVVGTVAYGVWFNDDQRAYVEAMTGAREALGITASTASVTSAASVRPTTPALSTASARPTAPAISAAMAKPTTPSESSESTVLATEDDPPSEHAVWAGQVRRSSSPPSRETAAAAADPIAPMPPVRSARRAALSPDSAAPQLADARSGRESRIAPQDRRTQVSARKAKPSVFARVRQFFRRVSYRQHGTGSRQDNYSHP